MASSIQRAIERNQARQAALQAKGKEDTHYPAEGPAPAPAFPGQDLNIPLPVRGTMPAGTVLDSDLNISNRAFRSGPVRSAVYPFPAPITNTGSDKVAQIQAQVAKVQTGIVTAQTAASQAATKASSANDAANTASTGVSTINSHAAVALVGGTLQQVPIASLSNTTATPTQDNLDDGSTFARVLSTALTGNAIDTTKPGVIAQYGCFPSTIVGTSAAIFSYTSTATSATISWTSFTVFWADGTTATIASGSQNITGLTAGTYQYYPNIAAGSTTVTFISVSGAVGTPAIFYAGASPTAAQQQNLASNTALSIGSVTIHVTAGGSGSGGGSGMCAKADQFVIEEIRGTVRLDSCVPGEKLLSRHGWAEIQSLKLVPQSTFIRVETSSGTLFITPTHHVTAIRDSVEQSIPAAKLQLSDVLFARDAYAVIRSISVIEEANAHKAIIHLEPTHEFWCGTDAPTLSAANQIPVS